MSSFASPFGLARVDTSINLVQSTNASLESERRVDINAADGLALFSLLAVLCVVLILA